MPLLIAFGISLVLTPLAGWVGSRTGLVDEPPATPPSIVSEPLKIHRTPVSVLGGVAVTLAALSGAMTAGGNVPPGVAAAALLALAVGLADDVRPLSPGVRLAGLTGSGILVAAGGSRFGTSDWLGAAALVLLVVVCANAVNLVDGQDGLAGGLAAIASLGLHFAAGPHASGMGLALSGALVAFLLWNRPPARIFLGNGGAYAIGVILAALAASVSAAEESRGVVVSVLCLGVFAFELATTIGRRVVRGQRLTAGDREHAYDLLARRLGSRARSTVVFIGLSVLVVAMASVARATASPAGVVLAIAVASGGATGVTLWARSGVR